MKLSDFISLDEAEMKLIVLHYGTLVGKRTNDDSFVFLFQLNDFYVETYCNLKSKQVSEYRAFKNINLLNPYLDLIRIDELLH